MNQKQATAAILEEWNVKERPYPNDKIVGDTIRILWFNMDWFEDFEWFKGLLLIILHGTQLVRQTVKGLDIIIIKLTHDY